MFLSRRATQAEYFDEPGRTPAEVAESYHWLNHFNRLLHFAEPFQRLLPRWLGEEKCRDLSLLDLGAGDGSLGCELTRWAARRGWRWEVTHLEINPLAVQLNEAGRSVAGSAIALPFKDGSFDAVIATQMTHHLLNDEQVVRHFREAWRVSRDAVFINDLHRNLGLYCLIGFLLHWWGCPPNFRADGLLSVRRGWRVKEWKSLAAEANLSDARVWLYYGAKVVLQVCKAPPR